jgi:Mrr N-terminal domain
MQTIDLRDATFTRLLQRVRSFDDTADLVIERMLDATEEQELSEEHKVVATGVGRGPRAAPGSILPEKDYWPALLLVLVERGGRAPANDVIEEVGKRLADKLLPRDWEELAIGEIRWRNRVRFARLRLKERGMLRADSSRGVWEITDAGRTFLERELGGSSPDASASPAKERP